MEVFIAYFIPKVVLFLKSAGVDNIPAELV